MNGYSSDGTHKGTANLIPFSGANDSRRQNGRPKGVPNSKTIIEKFLKIKVPTPARLRRFIEENEISLYDGIILRALADAARGDKDARRDILDRLEGKPVQRIESKEVEEFESDSMEKTEYEIQRILNGETNSNTD